MIEKDSMWREIKLSPSTFMTFYHMEYNLGVVKYLFI